MGHQHIPEVINLRVEETVHFFMVVHTLHIYLPVVQVHSTWSIIRDFGHNDDFVILEFSGFLRDLDLVDVDSDPMVVSKEKLIKEVVIFCGVDSSARAGVYRDENVKVLL
jgi:hypothetical protein